MGIVRNYMYPAWSEVLPQHTYLLGGSRRWLWMLCGLNEVVTVGEKIRGVVVKMFLARFQEIHQWHRRMVRKVPERAQKF